MKHTSRLLILSCLFLSCTIVSCDKEEFDCIKPIPPLDCAQDLIPFDSENYNNLATDSVSVIDVRLEQTCLIVDFAYSGCERREVGVMAFLDQSPFIPVLNAKISNADPLEECLAFFMHTDTFDLTSVEVDLYFGITLNVYQWGESFTIGEE